MYKIIIINTIFATIMICFSICFGAEHFSEKLVRNQFRLQLPKYWKVAEFKTSELVNYGDEHEQLYKQAFTAKVLLTEELFVLSQEKYDISWLDSVAKPRILITLYGIAISKKIINEAWQIVLALENDPISGLGMPISAFKGKAIVKGTIEEKEFIDALREHKEEQYKVHVFARLERDLPGYLKLIEINLTEMYGLRMGTKSLIELTPPKFSASVVLEADTYVEAGSIHYITVLSPLYKKGQQKRIYGRVHPPRANDFETMMLELDNNIVNIVGKPFDFFEGKLLIEGDPKLERYKRENCDIYLSPN